MCTELSGPDFLDKLSDTALGNGLEVDADAFRCRAKQWREDQERADALDAENVRLVDEIASLRQRAQRVASELTA